MYVCGMYVVCGDVCMCVGMYVWVWGVCTFVCRGACRGVGTCVGVYVEYVCVSVYIYRHTWVICNRERERKPVARKEIKSAKVRARKY
jgi:hypothetical protein